MNKKELFKEVMQSGLYKKLDWVINAFTVTKNDNVKYPYKIVYDVTGCSYYNNDLELIKLTEVPINTPAFIAHEEITINKTDIEILDEDTLTTYGNWLTNCILLIYPFGNKIKYINKSNILNIIETTILEKFKSNVEEGETEDPDSFYVREYLKLGNAVLYLCNFSQIFTWGVTEKIITEPVWVKEEKQKLLDKYKDTLNETATVAKIDSELVDMYKDYIKDDPGTNFLISKKSVNIVAKKKFLTMGGQAGLDENTTKVDLVANSLTEGLDVQNFPAMMNTLRAGVFNRGAETVLGGVAVKGLLRASANLNVTTVDCGTRLGKLFDVDNTNYKKLIKFNIVSNDGYIAINDEEEAGKYLGKKIMKRSPMYCKLDKTDFCKVCLGVNLSNNPEALSIAVSEYGNSFLALFLAGAHAKELSLAKMNYTTALK